jgi:hypothetical protein
MGAVMRVQINRVDPQFFQTMRVPLLRGRNLVRGETHAQWSASRSRAPPGRGGPIGEEVFRRRGRHRRGSRGQRRLVKIEDSDSVEVYLPTHARPICLARPCW